MALTETVTDDGVIVSEHTYPFTVEELLSIAVFVLLPVALLLAGLTGLVLWLGPCCWAVALYSLWLAWARKHRSTVRVEFDHERLTVCWPYSKVPARSQPQHVVDLGLLDAAAVARAQRTGLPMNLLLSVSDNPMTVPIRVLGPLGSAALGEHLAAAEERGGDADDAVSPMGEAHALLAAIADGDARATRHEIGQGAN